MNTTRVSSILGVPWFSCFSTVITLLALACYGAPFASAQTGLIPLIPALHVERQGHTATPLADGTIFIAGGESAVGPTDQSESYDPVTQTLSIGPLSLVARADHTATLLANGRVLVIGGRDAKGTLSSIEIYDPVAGAFSAGPDLNLARSGHSATVLQDGRVLVAGGDSAGTAEVYDPGTGQFTLLGVQLGTPRAFHGAALLKSGKVLLAGGSGGLSSAEVYSPATGAFAPVANGLAVSRVRPTLRVLPDGKVQIIGGASDRSIEVYDPADNLFGAHAKVLNGSNTAGDVLNTQTGAALLYKGSTLDPALDELLNRGNYSLTELPQRNETLVGGGVDSGNQILNSAYVLGSSQASVTTDKLDYAPFETVTFSGAGWQPGETVDMVLHEEPNTGPDIPALPVQADSQGKFTFDAFAPDEGDLGVTFTLTAWGLSSGFTAQTAFTDALPTRIQASSISPSSGACGSTITASARLEGKNPASSPFVPLPGKTVTFTLGSSTGSGITSLSGVATASLTVPAGATLLVAAFSADGTYNAVSTSISFTVTGSCVSATTLSVASATGTYGGTTNLQATLTKTSDSSGVGGKAISFTVNGNSVGSATTNSSGVATLSNVSLAGINAGPYAFGVGASFASDSSFSASSGSASLTVSKLAASVTPNAASKTYGDADPAFTGTLTGFLDADGVTATYNRTAGETLLGSPYTISATLSPAGVLGNYTITYNTATFTIDPKAASVTPNAASKTYGDADPVFTGTLTGFLDADGVTATYNRTAGETLLGSPYTISATLSPAGVLGNYTITYNTATFTIDPKAASVTPNAASKTYGDADPVFTGTLTGFLDADGVTATYSRTAGETLLGSPYTISATLSPAGVLGNYTITYNTATFTIDPKAASVTPNAASKTYGDADPAFTGTLTGFLDADGVTATYNRTAGETLLGSPYTISATLSPAGVLGNYTITYNTATFTIDPKAASVTPNAASKTYGDADPAFTGTLTGFLDADGVTATYNRTAGETVLGSYTISATLSPAGVLGNYTITYNTATFTIDPKAASVTPNAASKTYGDADPAFTGTLTGFLDADGVTATYNRTAGETLLGSPYTISATLSPAGVLGNYTITYNTATFTIDPKAASVTPNAASKTYGDADPAFTGTLTGFLDADGVTATYNRTAGETLLGSPYTISATLSPAGVLGNYTITSNTATFTIDPKAASVTPNAASKTYGDADPVFTGTLTGFLDADGVTATYNRTAGETVLGSPYTISATLSPAGVLGNYTITYNTATFTITKATLTVTAAYKTKILNAQNPGFTYLITGFKNGETEATAAGYSTSCTSTATQVSPVGAYPITCSGGAADNYTFQYVPGTLSIIYATGGLCLGSPGHQILQPINFPQNDSVFKKGSTVPAKFRVCDANGISVGTAGIVSSFRLVQIINGTVSEVDEAVVSTTPDTAFRWSPTDALWIFNSNTKSLNAGKTYVYRITLNDLSTIEFQYGLK